MTILVTGATGNVGGSVLQQLLQTGAQIRATSRNPLTAGLPESVDVRAADLADPGSFKEALEGVEKVFLFPSPAGIEGFLEVAKAANVRHIVALSSLAAAYPGDNDSPVRMMHLTVEHAIEKSGIDWTFVQPGAFATNTLAWARSIRQDGVVRLPFPDSQSSPIHEYDIAEVAVAVLLNDGHTSAKYRLTGGESITQHRQVDLIGEAVGRSLRVEVQTRDEAYEDLLKQFGQFGSAKLVNSLLDMTEAAVDHPGDLETGVQDVLGREPRTFAEWAVDHKADFAG
ncbi:uncharacterized protein YbjT (DUF2867 family) [Kibdelosporangium banguiense]|uniref:Uncharacterized protein YbjT (DUF2867 family) n=1 Tax=Kibdelosporangium banguiense TaxID=1365924 RepID=A0ABS4TAX8_9PSEU|nr:NAD(P)H-binding protein [Kibdelosporangium banguiense]MBP2320996.1 uncharacterized protein YbjT (DUF2867 family) [Kibdelosporangium banguiense]